MVSVLFVCLANICRSPAAEGVLRHLAQKEGLELHIESCGLGDWNLGQLPDARMRDAAKNRGVILSSRSQRFHPEFFERFDLILVADNKILSDLYRYASKPEAKAKMHLITHFSKVYTDQEIPDPYYNGEAGFENVLNMIEESCEELLVHLKKTS